MHDQREMIEIGYWNWLTQRSKLEIGKLIVGKLDDPEVEIGWPDSRNWELVDRQVEIVWLKSRNWELSDPKVKNWKLNNLEIKFKNLVIGIENWNLNLEIGWPRGQDWRIEWSEDLNWKLVGKISNMRNWLTLRIEMTWINKGEWWVRVRARIKYRDHVSEPGSIKGSSQSSNKERDLESEPGSTKENKGLESELK